MGTELEVLSGSTLSLPSSETERRMQRFCEVHQLSPREGEVLDLVCRGQHPKAIGDTIGSSYASVRTHLRRIYKKVGCSGLRELVIRYFAAELTPPSP